MKRAAKEQPKPLLRYLINGKDPIKPMASRTQVRLLPISPFSEGWLFRLSRSERHLRPRRAICIAGEIFQTGCSNCQSYLPLSRE